jgi:hypothetical protein
MMAKLPYAGVFCGLVAILGCNSPTAKPPQPTERATAVGSTPAIQSPVSINAEMVRVVDHAAHELWNVEREGMGPKTEADWENVVEHATQVAAAGALIRLEGTGPNDRMLVQQPEWQKFAGDISSAGLSALHAAEMKDLQALVTADGQLVEACEGCHKRYKPAIPSEGIMHTHVHR